MSLEKGSEKQKENTDLNTQALLEIVRDLQKEIKTLKEERSTNTAGIDPSLMAEIFAKANVAAEKQRTLDFSKGIKEEEIPADDYLKEGVVFCAPFTMYAIADDRRKGHVVRLPYNKESIFFKYQGTRKNVSGKQTSLASFSTYTSYSKKEAEWLRNHTMFNVMFYESSNQAISVDVVRAQKLARIMTSLAAFEMPSILSRCKENDVPIGTDIGVMKAALAQKMLEREMASERTSIQNRLAEIEKEKALLMGNQ
jgi:hypothetical protein